LIDSFTEGLIEKDQFTSRMDRTKRRIADLDAKIRDDAGDVDRRENLRLATNRLCELAAAIGTEVAVPAGIAEGRLSGHSSTELR
jgi:hypothetical protein